MDYLAHAKNAFTTVKAQDGTDRIVFSDSIPTDLRDIMLEIMRKSENQFDISYSIMSDAVSSLPGSLDEYDEDDIYESEHASVYTADRLAYLTIWNQDEITQMVKEYGCDIATACAYWYEEQVQNMFFSLVSELQGLSE